MNLIAAQSGGNPLVTFLPLILIFVVFYFLMIRPQNKRRQAQVQMQSNLEPGARVLTTNGMYATVVEVDDDGLVLEIAPGVEARFVKQSVMQVLAEDTDDTESDEADETDEDGTTAEAEATETAEAAESDAGKGADLTKGSTSKQTSA